MFNFTHDTFNKNEILCTPLEIQYQTITSTNKFKSGL